MAERAVFLSSRFGDAATLVGSTEQGSLSVGNLQDRRPEKKWRATGDSAEYVTIDLGAACACNALVLVGHNLSSAATLRVRGAASAAAVTASPVVDSGADSAWPSSGKHSDPDWPQEFSLVRFTSGTYRYWRLDIADDSNPDGYVEAGRLFIGSLFQPTFNVDTNVGLGLISPDARVRSPFGRSYSDPRGPASRRLTLPISAVDEAEMTAGLFELQRYCGLARDIAFCLDPSATTKFHTFSLQALFETDAAFGAEPWFHQDANVWKAELSLIEIL
jgi:hypothetical protein